MQRTWVWSLVQKLRSHMPWSNKARVLQRLSLCPKTRESVHCKKRSCMTQDQSSQINNLQKLIIICNYIKKIIVEGINLAQSRHRDAWKKDSQNNICGMICLYKDITKQKEAICFRDANNAEGFPGGSDGKEPACNAEGLGSTPGLGRSPGEENGKPLQYSCL